MQSIKVLDSVNASHILSDHMPGGPGNHNTSDMHYDNGSGGEDQLPEMTIEEELLDYQRRFKNMENERKIFADEASAQLKRHKALIEKLNRENEQMREDLQIALVQHSKETATKGTIKASTASLVAK